MGRSDDENLGIAFGLVIGAGAATGLGAAVVFVPALVRLASRKTLAGALGLSAGVMSYVSFVEIFAKSSLAFEDAGHDEDKAYIYATLCFFAGIILMVVSIEYHLETATASPSFPAGQPIAWSTDSEIQELDRYKYQNILY